ncbi:hypothetical protein PR048_004012 [Dryococelus australis]|uniref:Uncharacterized protein n=1 Tax=Dryococelus australis TaxID=614101 RepID=A0ABQ9I494_9NEOP|nr:hypothetical protein PR048_004012 [Dryococelus australis]
MAVASDAPDQAHLAMSLADSPAPRDIVEKWKSIRSELPCHSIISIPRCIIHPHIHSAIEVHGFADSSEKGDAAVVYL